MSKKPTYLGVVATVSGASIGIKLSKNVASGIAVIGGKSYRTGQVGSFVRIPQGYHDLYGIVSQVGADAIPEVLKNSHEISERWMTVQLVGEIVSVSFERGISQYPNIHDEVHLVTEEDLAIIYGNSAKGQIEIGRLANAEGIPVKIDLDKLITRHSAVLGSTGSGKSTTVASLLRAITRGAQNGSSADFPNARILLLDLHGEYGRALGSVSKVFRVNPEPGEHSLRIPFWALDPGELLGFLMGKLDDKQQIQIFDRIYEFKTSIATKIKMDGIDLNSMTASSPIPFSLKKLWFELLEPEIKTWNDSQRTTPALETAGDAQLLKIPKYKPAGSGSSPPFLNQTGLLGIRRQLDQMRSRLLDRQYDFLLHPGDWEPDLEGITIKDLPELLQSWLGHDKQVTILDLSGIPSAVVARLAGAILRIVYDSLTWGREKSEGGIARPLLIVMEEAHRYLAKDSEGPALGMVQKIVKEGRKFGIGAMIVSQRPSEVDETILSQCGTFITLRLSNSADRGKIQASLPDNLAGVVDSLPVLRIGEAVITGEAARLPIRCRITLPAEEHRPNSEDPLVSKQWQQNFLASDYKKIAASWRAQNPLWASDRVKREPITNKESNKMERTAVTSSAIVSVGYEPQSEILEIEFEKSGIYQYYNVPEAVYQQLMSADSIGIFVNVNIKPFFSCSRV